MLSNAALRVDLVFSNDASCVAIHKSSAYMKLRVSLCQLVICVNVEEHR